MRPDGWCNAPKPASASSPALVSWLNIEVKPPSISVPHCKDTAQITLCTAHNTVFILANISLILHESLVADEVILRQLVHVDSTVI